MRIIRTNKTKEECLERAMEHQWLADNSPDALAAAYSWDQARLWRSRYYVAKPAIPSNEVSQIFDGVG